MTYTNWCTPQNSIENSLAIHTSLPTKADIFRLFIQAPVQTIFALWNEVKKQRQLVHMIQLDNRQLADIGVSRDDIVAALRQPTARTAAYALMRSRCDNAMS